MADRPEIEEARRIAESVIESQQSERLSDRFLNEHLLVPLAIFYWWVWGLWIVLLVVVLRLYHPPTLDDSIPLRPRHFALGLIALVMLVLCFTPVPIS